jgi:hypothetical protein
MFVLLFGVCIYNDVCTRESNSLEWAVGDSVPRYH